MFLPPPQTFCFKDSSVRIFNNFWVAELSYFQSEIKDFTEVYIKNIETKLINISLNTKLQNIMHKKSIIRKTLIFLAFVLIINLSGCGTHINEFARFNLTNKNVLFKQYVNPDLTRVHVDIDGYHCDESLVTIILKEVGGAIAENSVREKIQNAINSDSIASAISDGIIDGMKTYFYTNTVESLEENPQYIAETRLERFRIVSNTSGIYAMIDTRIIITDRGTAKTVWENTECADIPIGDVIYDFTFNRYVRTAKGIINAARLMQMSEEEIRAAIDIAAGEAGRRQSDQLREDIANKN